MAAREFRHLARIGLEGANDAMFTACGAMTSTQRRAADSSETPELGRTNAPLDS